MLPTACRYHGHSTSPINFEGCDSFTISRSTFEQTDGVIFLTNSEFFSMDDSFVIEVKSRTTEQGSPIALLNSTSAWMQRVCFFTCNGLSGQTIQIMSPHDGAGKGHYNQITMFQCSPDAVTGTDAAMLVRRGRVTAANINATDCRVSGHGAALSIQPYEGALKGLISVACSGASGVSFGQVVAFGTMIGIKVSHSAIVHGAFSLYEIRIVQLDAVFDHVVSVNTNDTRVMLVSGSVCFQTCRFDHELVINSERFETDSIATNDQYIGTYFADIPCALTNRKTHLPNMHLFHSLCAICVVS